MWSRPTAILLAAGVGKRMGPDAGPKCLLRVGGKSLLRRTLESLRAVGIREVVLVVGFRKDEVISEARCFAGADTHLEIIENDRYREGAILSLWSARAFLDRPVLVMDADVLCPPSVFERLVESPHSSCILVDSSSADTGEEQMVFGLQGRVFHIAKRAGEEVRKRWRLFGESIGFLRLSWDGALVLRKLLEEKVNAGIVDIEHEQVYPQLFEKIFVGYETVDGTAWTEVDTPEDLERARSEVFPRWSPPKCVNRRMSDLFFPWIARLPMTPNQWTLTGFFLGALALACWADGGYGTGLLGAAFFQLFYWTDNWDGDLARLRGLSSPWGTWLDLSVDAVIQVALPLAIVSGVKAMGAQGWMIAVGWVASAGVALSFAVTLWAKARGFGPAVHSHRALRFGPKDSGWARWVRVNCTNENFSLIVLLVFLLDLRRTFLLAMAVGCHVYWIQFAWKERYRLVQWAS